MEHADKKGKIDWKAVEKKLKEGKPDEKGGSGISLASENKTGKGK